LGFINFGIKPVNTKLQKTAIFSTAVTQGATSILIKALEDSNGLSIEENI
jgi:hypothetical protein